MGKSAKTHPAIKLNTKWSTPLKTDFELYDLGNFEFQCGITLHGAKLAYKTFGTLNAAKTNAIVYPTWYSGLISENYWLVGSQMGLNPDEYFVIIPALFGNGESSSPINSPEPCNGPRFPDVTMYDNVRAQHQLVTDHFGIEHLKLVLGWSMGAGQSYQWAVSYPDMMDAIIPFCGSSHTSPNNFVFLEAVRGAIMTDAAWREGWYDNQPKRGLRAAARVYAGWGFSGEYYWDEEWKKLGFSSLEDFLVNYWEAFFLSRPDANGLLTLARTWQTADVGKTPGFGGDTERALGSIKARVIQMPGDHDRYFAVKEENWATKYIKHCEFRPIPSTWGHFAGIGANKVDTDFIDSAVREVLGSIK